MQDCPTPYEESYGKEGVYGHRGLPPSTPYAVNYPNDECRYVRVLLADGEYIAIKLINGGEMSPEREFFMTHYD